MFSLATPPTVEEILDKMNYDLVMSLTVEAPVSTEGILCKVLQCTVNQYLSFCYFLSIGSLLICCFIKVPTCIM